MILLYVIHLLLVLLFSMGVIVFVVSLSFNKSWKAFTGMALSGAIFLAALSLSFQAFNLRQDGVELSKLVDQATLYFQKKNRSFVP